MLVRPLNEAVVELALVAIVNFADRAVGGDEVDHVDVLGMGVDHPHEAGERAAGRVLGVLVFSRMTRGLGEGVLADLLDDLGDVVVEAVGRRSVVALCPRPSQSGWRRRRTSAPCRRRRG